MELNPEYWAIMQRLIRDKYQEYGDYRLITQQDMDEAHQASVREVRAHGAS